MTAKRRSAPKKSKAKKRPAPKKPSNPAPVAQPIIYPEVVAERAKPTIWERFVTYWFKVPDARRR